MRDIVTPMIAPGEVGFLNGGVVTASKRCAIIASLKDANSVAGEELRLLRSRVRSVCQAGNLRCLALTSALPGEGKSTLALGLAAAFARDQGRRVLLIEADLRRPTVSKSLGLPAAPGLGEWLNGGLDQVPIRRVEPGGFSLLVAGQTPVERPESLGSAQMARLLRAARNSFDDVLLDVPPLVPVADTTLMQDLLDGILLVVRSRLTPREAIVNALGRLHPEKVIGVILNDHQEYRHSYSAYSYKRYGMDEGPPSSSRPKGRR